MKLKLISISVAATALLMAAPPAYAANWIFVGSDVDHTLYYYDLESIQRSGNNVTVWEKMDHSRDKTRKERQSIVRQRYDCAERTATILNAIGYFPDGKTDSYTWESYEQNAMAIAPGTVGEDRLKAVCAASAP